MFGMTRGTKKGEIRSGPRSPRSAKASISSEISLKPPIPVPNSQPMRVRSSFANSRPDWSMAILAAATPTWLKRAIRLASLKSMYLRGSKFLSSATVLTGRSETSKVVAIPSPDRPSIRLSQNSARLFPFGARTPMPVTTTRCSGRAPFPAMPSCYERRALRLGFLLRDGRRHRRRDCRDHLAVHGVARDADRIEGRAGIRAAVRYHRHPVDAEEDGPTELAPVGAPADGPQLGADQQPAEGRDRVALHRVPHALEDELGGTLSGLDQDVAAEAVGDHDIGLASEDVLAFDVADEIDAFERAEQRFARLDQLVALAGLLAIAEQRHPWRFETHQLLGVDTPHQRVLDEVLRLCIGVGTDVQQIAVLPRRRRDDRADRPPIDAGHPVKPEKRRAHHRTAVPCADEAADPSVLDHRAGPDNRRVLLSSDRLRRMLIHRDHLGRILDLCPLPGARCGEGGINLVLDADEDHLNPELAVRLHAARHHLVGSEITTHRIERDFHWDPGLGATRCPGCARSWRASE